MNSQAAMIIAQDRIDGHLREAQQEQLARQAREARRSAPERPGTTRLADGWLLVRRLLGQPAGS